MFERVARLKEINLEKNRLLSARLFRKFEFPRFFPSYFYENIVEFLKLASFKEDQRPNLCNAASHVGATVLANVARSGRLAAVLR